MAANQFGDSTFPIVLGQVNDGTVTRNVTQTFLTQSATLASYYANVAQRIFFNGAYPGPLGGPSGEIGQLATHNFIYVDCENTFFDGATDNRAGYNQQADIHQYIGFTDRYLADPVADIMFSRYNDDPPASRAGLVFDRDATNAFSFNDHSELGDALVRTYPISNTLGFSETLTHSPEVDDLYDTIFVTGQTIDTVGTDFGGDFAQTFLRQHVAYRVTRSASPERSYSPFIGNSDDTTYDEVPAAAPTLGQGVLTLTYPRVTPTLTLVLKNPEFGNLDVIRFTKVDRRTRGGDRKFFTDSGWGSTQSFELEITNVCDTTATIDEILEFLNTSLGGEVGLLDWENRQWKGIIVAPETDVIPQVGGHTVRIIFEGELV